MRSSFRCLLLGMLLAACNSSSTGSGGSGGPIPESQFGARFAAAFCDNIGQCCSSAGYNYDPAGCKAAIAAQVGQGYSGDVYDADIAGQCVEGIAAAARACKNIPSSVFAVCESIYSGTVALGQPCQSQQDCAQDAARDVLCGENSPTGPSLCIASPIVKLGDACATTCGHGWCGASAGPRCMLADKLYCDPQTRKCAPAIAIGQPCSFQNCVGTGFCYNGACQTKLPVGSDCSFGVGSIDDVCAGDMACDKQGKCAEPNSGPLASPTLCSGQQTAGTGGTGATGGGGSGG